MRSQSAPMNFEAVLAHQTARGRHWSRQGRLRGRGRLLLTRLLMLTHALHVHESSPAPIAFVRQVVLGDLAPEKVQLGHAFG